MKLTPFLYSVAILSIAPVAAAQDGTADPAPGGGGSVGSTFFENAGLIGMVIIGLSVLALTLIIKEIMAIRRDQLAPPELVDEMEALFEAGEYQEAIELCETEPCYFTNIVIKIICVIM